MADRPDPHLQRMPSTTGAAQTRARGVRCDLSSESGSGTGWLIGPRSTGPAPTRRPSCTAGEIAGLSSSPPGDAGLLRFPAVGQSPRPLTGATADRAAGALWPCWQACLRRTFPGQAARMACIHVPTLLEQPAVEMDRRDLLANRVTSRHHFRLVTTHRLQLAQQFVQSGEEPRGHEPTAL